MTTIDPQRSVVEGAVVEREFEAMDLKDSKRAVSVDEPTNYTPSSEGIIKTPFPEPITSIKLPPTTVLKPDQEAKYDALLEIVVGWKEIPSSNGKSGPITEGEIMWLTRECLLRYLRATKWVTAEAAKRIVGTLSWRRDYGIEDLLDGKIVSPENETGKQIILGYDIAGRACHYLSPGRQNTQPSPRQVQHLVFMMERVIDLMIPGQETLALLINFKSSKTRSNTAPGIGQGREVLNILQTHYPERLGRSLIINIPWVVWGFFKLITPFIDPLTREKLKFNEDVREYVPPEHLWTEFGGDAKFEYDHSTYWPALLKLCEEKRTERKARWEKAGKKYGESEVYLRGGANPDQALTSSASQSTAPEEKENCPPEQVEEKLADVEIPTDVHCKSSLAATTDVQEVTTSKAEA